MDPWEYSTEEWREISESTVFGALPTHQIGLLHRHWLWADHARLTFEDAVRSDTRTDAMDFASRRNWATYVWYGLLYALIEGLTERKVRCGGELARDVRAIREPLRQARNATFHVGGEDSYWDMRLFEISAIPASAHQITRAHLATGQLLVDELRSRNAADEPPA